MPRKMLKEHSRASRFQNFLRRGGGCPQTSQGARAFGDRDLPRLALKSGQALTKILHPNTLFFSTQILGPPPPQKKNVTKMLG